jgi:hypothetical protein
MLSSALEEKSLPSAVVSSLAVSHFDFKFFSPCGISAKSLLNHILSYILLVNLSLIDFLRIPYFQSSNIFKEYLF